METVVAKFRCSSVTDTDYNEVVVHLYAEYGENGENKDFTDATPCGNLDMHISKGAPAHKFFNQGEVYFLTFKKE